MINVTKTFFPPLEEYQAQLQRIWNNQWLTNRGELVVELEEKLKNYLAVNHILVTNNGTIPIQIALKLLGNGGEIITTPFSYVATSAAIVWEHCTPVFVDIHPEYLTIDETRIEAHPRPCGVGAQRSRRLRQCPPARCDAGAPGGRVAGQCPAARERRRARAGHRAA